MIQGWYWKRKCWSLSGLKEAVMKKIYLLIQASIWIWEKHLMFSHVTGWLSWRWNQKGVNSSVTIRWLLWKLERLRNTPWLAILMITVCWGNWNVSPQAGTFHMTLTVISYEITWEKCICVSRAIVSTVPPSDKN